MIILGINAYHGDVSAASLCDGELVAAVEEERFRDGVCKNHGMLSFCSVQAGKCTSCPSAV